MTIPYHEDEATRIFVGDAHDVLSGMPDASVDCVVTSPPYWGLRDYGHPDQYGAEDSPEDYIHTLCTTFDQVHRVLADDGTLWINIGDRYAANSDGCRRGQGFHDRQPFTRPASDLAPKNLLGLPWRLAFALQTHDWVLRNAVIWHKPNAMPESVTDRLSCRYEHIFLFVKQRRYHFDLDPIRRPYTDDRTLPRRSRTGGTRRNSITTTWPPIGGTRGTQGCTGPSARRRSGTDGKYADADPAFRGKAHGTQMQPTGTRHAAAHPNGRNPGDVWTIPTRPYRQAHFAVFPIDIPLRAIAAGCREGGTVLDPFAGAGTTLLAAHQLDRHAVGIDVNPAYAELALTRLRRAHGAKGGKR
ncbi:site-specific DNA-methyltransferase (cytosine-N4-specific) [Spinactinospora alkalitolerans]|uniref:Methyltransferase n=1 Tax=Spinactinospora alkalitolerans TaxID=687207 RepID=A0A852U7F2_9ACTN|nr:site-specific DNA-methyltransferase [Spinactinospora alkalitolerans]NYE49994.1 site-specific DNA-methyltransferase (cytosine-N4-specific) [Spinactinospora alkalitolerans]